MEVQELSDKVLRIAYDHQNEFPGGSFPISRNKAKDFDVDMPTIHNICQYLEVRKCVKIVDVVRDVSGCQIVTLRIEITEAGRKLVEKKMDPKE